MIVIITGGELIDLGLWYRARTLLGGGFWAIDESGVDRTHNFCFNVEQAIELGIVHERVNGRGLK